VVEAFGDQVWELDSFTVAGTRVSGEAVVTVVAGSVFIGAMCGAYAGDDQIVDDPDCPQGLDFDRAFLDALAQAGEARLERGRLLVLHDRFMMVFAIARITERWTLDSWFTSTGPQHAQGDGFIEFRSGLVLGSSGCRRFAGLVDAREGHMMVNGLEVSEESCSGPAHDQDVHFFDVLGQDMWASTEDPALTLYTTAGDGIGFVRGP